MGKLAYEPWTSDSNDLRRKREKQRKQREADNKRDRQRREYNARKLLQPKPTLTPARAVKAQQPSPEKRER